VIFDCPNPLLGTPQGFAVELFVWPKETGVAGLAGAVLPRESLPVRSPKLFVEGSCGVEDLLETLFIGVEGGANGFEFVGLVVAESKTGLELFCQGLDPLEVEGLPKTLVVEECEGAPKTDDVFEGWDGAPKTLEFVEACDGVPKTPSVVEG
jgi:hypothetical protein